jgi:hypothetical protein
MSSQKILFGLLMSAALATSCYDSTWGETKRGQTRNLKAATPATLDANESDKPHLKPPAHSYRLRIYATPSYISQTFDWQKQVRDLVADANDVLAADVDMKLDIESMTSWDDAGVEDRLDTELRALHAKDSGEDVDWVAGFIGGVSRTGPSFHELGFGDEPGKYVVLRAVSSAGERDSIDHAFDKLSEDERTRLSRTRKQHRATSVFLHEIGHTLAAVHERDPHSIMNPVYDARMSGFTSDALSLMHVSLAHRDHLTTNQEMDSYAKALLTILQGPSSGVWVPTDRNDLITRLEHVVTPQTSIAAAPPPTASAAAPAPEPIADEPLLSATDQPIYKHASELLQKGDATGAGDLAKPLFSAYLKVFSVQDLRCKIAMKRDGWPAAEKECKPLLKLSK